MKADPEQQARLLDLARLDAEAGTLMTRARTLPARAERERLAAALETLRADLAARTDEADAARRALTAHGDRSEALRARIDREQNDLDSGKGLSRELLALQTSLVAQREQLSGYDDAEMDLMEAAEAADATREAARREVDAAAAGLAELTARLTEEVDALRAEHTDVRRRRQDVAAAVEERLLAAYDRLAGRLVTGAAEVRDGSCTGCGMELPPAARAELSAAAPDTVSTCEDCGRFLIRTP
jgi:uncharacterized protein